MLAVATGYAQDCYNSTRSKGIRLYNQGKKTEAKRMFEAAQSCPDKPDNNDLASWIGKCNTDKGKSQTSKKIEKIFRNLVTFCILFAVERVDYA